MADSDVLQIKHPKIYFLRMVVFLVLTGFVAGILFPQIERSFMANPGLNGMIVGVLLLGCAYAFRQILRLIPEIRWINDFRLADPGLALQRSPVLLAPMATLLRDRQGPVALNTQSMRSLMESIATRLDEARDISRYMIGLLIFLGLLGTFWGLLETVNSIGQTIAALKVGETSTLAVFEDLKAGLAAPLQGMGTAFSSSLFGLAGSLVLGFLDLQASQAQNRFYNELEEWLSTITDLQLGEAASGPVPAHLQLSVRAMQQSIDRLDRTVKESQGGDNSSLDALAKGVEELVHQMRNEQRALRQWVHSQSEQNTTMRNALADIVEQTRNGPKPGE